MYQAIMHHRYFYLNFAYIECFSYLANIFSLFYGIIFIITDVIELNENNNTTSDHNQAMEESSDKELAQKENINNTTTSEEPIHSRHHGAIHEESPLNLPQDSFGGDWIEREIEGLNKKCYDSGNFANRFITILMTNLVTETAFEPTLVESNQVNTVYFNKNEKQEGCLPADVSEFFTSSCV